MRFTKWLQVYQFFTLAINNCLPLKGLFLQIKMSFCLIKLLHHRRTFLLNIWSRKICHQPLALSNELFSIALGAQSCRWLFGRGEGHPDSKRRAFDQICGPTCFSLKTCFTTQDGRFRVYNTLKNLKQGGQKQIKDSWQTMRMVPRRLSQLRALLQEPLLPSGSAMPSVPFKL